MLLAEVASSSYARRTQICLADGKTSTARRKRGGTTYAYTASANTYSQTGTQHSGNERLLRYPDGRVRCIRYPPITTEFDRLPEQMDPSMSYEEDWDPDRWDDMDWDWDVLSQQNSASAITNSTPFVRPSPQKVATFI